MGYNAMGMDPCDLQNNAIFNITTEKTTHVDARTGLFEAHVPLPSVTGNHGYGPVVDMSLYYSPVVNNIAALGDGWSFSFTTWYEKNNDLTLHSGESLTVEKGKNLTTPAIMIRWADNDNELIVERKDGRTEILRKAGASEIWAPERLTTDGYRYLDFTWTIVEQIVGSTGHGRNYQVCLATIRDPERTLVQISYDELSASQSKVALNFWPSSSEALTFELLVADFCLKSVQAPEETRAFFDYTYHQNCGWLLNQIESFDGVVENVVYADSGLRFEGNLKLSMLPVVTKHTLTPLGGGNPFTHEYKYSLCANSSGVTGKLAGESEYETVVTNKAQTIAYLYRRDNEMSADLLKEGGHERVRIFSSVDKQAVGTSKDFSRSIVTRYDGTSREAGYSLITEKGLVLRLDNSSYTYLIYDEAAAGLSDEDAFRSSRLLKERTGASNIRPDESSLIAYSDMQFEVRDVTAEGHLAYCAMTGRPSSDLVRDTKVALGALAAYMLVRDQPFVTEKTYTYTSVPGLNREKLSFLRQATPWDGVETAFVQPIEGAAIGQRIEYYEDNDFRKGRQKAIHQGNVPLKTRSRKNPSLVWEGGLPRLLNPAPEDQTFLASTGSSISLEYALDPASATITTTTTETRGSASRSSVEVRSVLSGRLVSQTDSDANRTDYGYDGYGRLTTQTICAQSPEYKETTAYAYPVTGRIEITEANGRGRALESDGMDNTVREQVRAAAGDPWRDALTTVYDGLGRKTSSTRCDYLADGTKIAETCDFSYDPWGNECTQSYSDGRVSNNYYDPITRIRNEWTGSALDKQRKRTTYEANDAAGKVEWLDTGGETYQEESFTYTALGKVASHRVTGVHGVRSVAYEYDGFGRLLTELNEHDGYKHSLTYSYPDDWLINEPCQTDVDTHLNQYDNGKGTLGSRTFDDWGRVTSLTRAGVTETYTYTAARTVPDSKTTADGQTVTYEYIKELGNRVSRVTDKTTGLGKSFSYAHGAVRRSTASEGECMLTFGHDANERVTSTRSRLTKVADKTVDQAFSPAGRLLRETDARGVAAVYQYDGQGRRTGVTAGDVKTTHAYDASGRLAQEQVDVAAESIAVKYTYDALGREVARRFQKSAGLDLIVERSYYADNRLRSMELKEGSSSLGKRSFIYTAGEQVARCETTGVWQPTTPKGKPISSQVFLYDGLGNVTNTTSTFEGGACISVYNYDVATGSRLLRVTHTHDDYRRDSTLEYDANGRITKDALGKTYSYDWLGRLKQVGSRYYTYDTMDNLATTGQGDSEHQVIYDGTQIRGEYRPDGTGRHIEAGSSACTVQRVKRTGVVRTLFELRDSDGTVLVTFDATAKTTRHHAYSAYGEHSSDEQESLLGFNGEYRDADNDQYPLGKGYRSYEPAAMRFHAPDAWSPFGEGGPHAYGYCHGDPINRKDPSGHWGSIGSRSINRGLRRVWGNSLPGPIRMGEQGALISTIIWSGLGVLTAIATGGTSLLLTAAIVIMAVIASATAIASVIVKDSDPKASEILGWVSFGFTIAAGGISAAWKALAFAAKLGRTVMNVARNAFHRVGVAASRLRANGAGALAKSRASAYRPASGADFRSADEVGEALAPVRSSGVRVFTSIEEGFPAAFDFQPVPPGQGGSFFRLLDKVHESLNIGDINTVICSVTGVLGLTGAFESDDANFVNGNVNNATWLPWGSFNLGH